MTYAIWVIKLQYQSSMYLHFGVRAQQINFFFSRGPYIYFESFSTMILYRSNAQDRCMAFFCFWRFKRRGRLTCCCMNKASFFLTTASFLVSAPVCDILMSSRFHVPRRYFFLFCPVHISCSINIKGYRLRPDGFLRFFSGAANVSYLYDSNNVTQHNTCTIQCNK